MSILNLYIFLLSNLVVLLDMFEIGTYMFRGDAGANLAVKLSNSSIT